MNKLILIVLLLPYLLACSATQAIAQKQVPTIAHTGIAALQTATSKQAVTITGIYTKWSGTCKGQPPISRGDWMLSDEHGCIYVHGTLPAAKVGTAVTVEGHIELTIDKRRYVALEKIVL